MFDTTKSVKRNGELTDPELWNRIRLAPLPATRDGSEFARALANATDTPLSDALEVEREYRRFLYLAAVSEAPRVPPAQVRQAWQMHARTPEYGAFCAAVLNKAFSYDDGTRMLGATTAYRHTLEDYLREFGKKPPRYIWPEAIAPRLPRWLGAHAAILGFTGALAWGQRAPLIFAAGLGFALALYAFDIWTSRIGARRKGIGAAVNDDLRFWLGKPQR